MKLHEVESSNVDYVGHDGKDLYIVFKNMGVYKYNDVPDDKFDNLLNSESIGKYLNKEIKKVYESEHIWDDDERYTMIIGAMVDNIFENPIYNDNLVS
jgi:hypothetical protein